MTARLSKLQVLARPELRRDAGGTNRPRRTAAALLCALVLPLAACSLLPLEPPEEPTERTPSPGTTNGPTGDPSDYVATCTDEGRLQTNGSTRGFDDQTQNSRGQSFWYAVVVIRSEDGGEPSAELLLQLPGADPENLAGLRVADTAEFDEWTLTIRSICADGVGFDAEVAD